MASGGALWVMADPHVITALVRKRAELAGEMHDLNRQRIDLRRRLNTVDQALKECGYGTDPKDIPARRKHGPKLFKNGHLRRMIYDIRRERPDLSVNREIAAEVMQRMGWEVGDDELLATVAEKVKDIRKVIGR